MDDIVVSKEGVIKLLKGLNPSKALEFSIRSSQPLKILIIKKLCNVRTLVTDE